MPNNENNPTHTGGNNIVDEELNQRLAAYRNQGLG
jgi:hypothetical protein